MRDHSAVDPGSRVVAGLADDAPGSGHASQRSVGALVDAVDVGKVFAAGRQEVEALSSVTLKLQPGSLTALLGPSGCGKTTFLRILAGVEEPSSGSALIDGDSPDRIRQNHGIGIAFQDHALLPWLSTRKNVALPFRLAGMPVDWDRVDELIQLVGLEDFAGARPRQLSGGMRQRTAIARSVILRPRLLLLDEPFGALDLVTRRILNIEMQRVLAEIGTTTLLVTHSVEEAALLADDVYVLAARPGRVIGSLHVDADRPRGTAYSESTTHYENSRRLGLMLDEAAGIRTDTKSEDASS